MLKIFPQIQAEILKTLASLTACARRTTNSDRDTADTSDQSTTELPISNQDIYIVFNPPGTEMCGKDSSEGSNYTRDCGIIRKVGLELAENTMQYLERNPDPLGLTPLNRLELGYLSYELVIRIQNYDCVSFEISFDPDDCPFDPEQIMNYAPVPSCRETYGVEMCSITSTDHNAYGAGLAFLGMSFTDENSIENFMIGASGDRIYGSTIVDQLYYKPINSDYPSQLGMVSKYIGFEGSETRANCLEPECSWEDAGGAMSVRKNILLNKFLYWLAEQKDGDDAIGLSEFGAIYSYDGYEFSLKENNKAPITARTNTSSKGERIAVIGGISIYNDTGNPVSELLTSQDQSVEQN